MARRRAASGRRAGEWRGGDAARGSPLLISLVLWLPKLAGSKLVHGRLSLGPQQAVVVTKFCFDYNPICLEHCPSVDQNPGSVDFVVHDAAVDGGGAQPHLHIALLDDEYFSFPEISQVWDEANCSDILKASKKVYPLEWAKVRTAAGVHMQHNLVEKVRPRWWYVALASCTDADVEVSYSLHLQNKLRGWQQEFSMDCQGLPIVTLLLLISCSVLAVSQVGSLRQWHKLHRRRDSPSLAMHPAMVLLTAGAVCAAVGEACCLAHCRLYQQTGESSRLWEVLGRLAIVISKNSMSLLLLLLSTGECICTTQINWDRHTELAGGLTAFALLSFSLEVWGDSEFQSTSTEYVYDTRPGIALVCFDVLWLWMFVSRSYTTFRKETRARARVFYRVYSPFFFVWFASLPLTAVLGRAVAPHVRAMVTCVTSGVAHVVALGVLVYTFQPSVAPQLYAFKETDVETVCHSDELHSMLGGEGIDDDVI